VVEVWILGFALTDCLFIAAEISLRLVLALDDALASGGETQSFHNDAVAALVKTGFLDLDVHTSKGASEQHRLLRSARVGNGRLGRMQ
jgi:hypothetical protein